jgi:hypothetical protein
MASRRKSTKKTSRNPINIIYIVVAVLALLLIYFLIQANQTQNPNVLEANIRAESEQKNEKTGKNIRRVNRVAEFTVSQPCDGKSNNHYSRAAFTCVDGTKGFLPSRNNKDISPSQAKQACRPLMAFKEEADKRCMKNIKVSPTYVSDPECAFSPEGCITNSPKPTDGFVCAQVITCVKGQQYPTSCGPKNGDVPIGEC